MIRMPSGIYPEVAFPRIVVIAQTPGLGVKDVEVAVTRPIEEVVGIVLGVVRVRSKSVPPGRPARERLRPRQRYDSGLERRPGPDGGGRHTAPCWHDHGHRTKTPTVFPMISFVVTGGRDPSGTSRLRLLRSAATDQPNPGRLLRHSARGRHSRDSDRGRSPGPVATNLSIADVADRLDEGTQAQGRWPAGPRCVSISGTRRHASGRSDRPGRPRHRREKWPIDSFAATSAVSRSGTRIARWRSGPTGKTPSP